MSKHPYLFSFISWRPQMFTPLCTFSARSAPLLSFIHLFHASATTPPSMSAAHPPSSSPPRLSFYIITNQPPLSIPRSPHELRIVIRKNFLDPTGPLAPRFVDLQQEKTENAQEAETCSRRGAGEFVVERFLQRSCSACVRGCGWCWKWHGDWNGDW